MLDIDKMSSNEWINYHRGRIENFYNKGLDFKPCKDCPTCDTENDYTCFNHELIQLEESENA